MKVAFLTICLSVWVSERGCVFKKHNFFFSLINSFAAMGTKLII